MQLTSHGWPSVLNLTWGVKSKYSYILFHSQQFIRFSQLETWDVEECLRLRWCSCCEIANMKTELIERVNFVYCCFSEISEYRFYRFNYRWASSIQRSFQLQSFSIDQIVWWWVRGFLPVFMIILGYCCRGCHLVIFIALLHNVPVDIFMKFQLIPPPLTYAEI